LSGIPRLLLICKNRASLRMRQILLVGLFAFLLSDVMLGLGLTLGPGLSLKNAVLYVIFIGLVLEFTLGGRDPLRETWPLHSAWFLLASYATFSWLVIVLLGAHRGYDAFDGFIALKGRMIDLFLFLLVYLYGAKNMTSTMNLLRWLIIIFVIVNFVTLLDVFNIPDLGIIIDRRDGRLAGPVNEVNQYGAVLIFIIPITVSLALGSSGILRLIFSVGALIAFVLLGLTVSRGSYLGLAAGGMAGLFLAREYVHREAIVKGSAIIFLMLILVAAAIAYQNPEGFMAKFDFAGSTLYGASSGRTEFWRQALTMMSFWPFSFISGYGWHSYGTIFLGYGDPHNTYLMYWFNLGIIGLGLYLFAATWVIRYSLSSLRYLSEEVRIIAIGFIIGFLALHAALFFVQVYMPWLFIWAISGTILRLIVENRRIADSQENNATQLEAS